MQVWNLVSKFSSNHEQKYENFKPSLRQLNLVSRMVLILLSYNYCAISDRKQILPRPKGGSYLKRFLRFRGTTEKKSTARCGGGLRSCLRICEPRCANTHLEKLGFGLDQDSTITSNFNLNMIQKKGFIKINRLVNS
jgi:hypothetical protein